MAKQVFPPITIIGAGAVGTAIAYALYDVGYPIVSVISKTLKSAQQLATTVQCKTASTSVQDISSSTQLLIVTVPDAIIPEIDRQVSLVKNLPFKKLITIHTAGILPASIFKKLKQKGVTTAAVHPIQTFPKLTKKNSSTVTLEGIYFGVDCEKKTIPNIKKIVGDLGGKIVFIPENLRPLYHTTCVFASSFLTVHMSAIAELSKSLKLTSPWLDVFNPLMTVSIQNLIQTSAGTSLTGPVIRKDFFTLESHLKSLNKFAPEIIPFYTVCTTEVARIATASGRISEKDYITITLLLNKFSKQQKAKRKVLS